MATIKELQEEHYLWVERNFPAALEDSTQGLLGLAEEVGELSHAQLKGIQGIRHTPEEIEEMKHDAVGDIFIYLMSYCNAEGIDLELEIHKTWAKVARRDWLANPLNADQVVAMEDANPQTAGD